jgi:chaperonin GroES
MNNYRLVNNFVLVKKIESDDKIGEVLLASSDRQIRSDGIIMNKSKNSKTVKINDTICFYKHSGIETKIGNDDFVVLDEDEILSILREIDGKISYHMTKDRVLVLENENKTELGGVILSESDSINRTSGIVISTSKSVTEIKENDEVMFSRYSGVYVTIKNKQYKVLDKKEIFIIL